MGHFSKLRVYQAIQRDLQLHDVASLPSMQINAELLFSALNMVKSDFERRWSKTKWKQFFQNQL